ncbi:MULTISPECIES: carboxyl-terminal processing protease CtpA [Cylindrospermopsis]|jgi:carboxyl-terminal processing protease|uniref:carboxyl-terminal processing protease CtpA n=1 Tax=Cylindrospermopsis TaxID=77021 RepID=UPI00070FC3A8|nr:MULTISPECIES: carboxyl-terminal processing protease CtpA [Cylindrospermopsis]MBU6344804.1 PDZ domain-containing protein [Cyanobacteria bacterium REEB494]KRH96037.1 carboxyl-terminal protease [Cylindrospermopsis sp. CR12]TPX28562.1 PDZ domain-containing protein [Cylindrospermopsis raciborskii GIHE 2018]UJL34104.1 PDZ domain-containing protein [Cylindrospermopsis raciborskii Cr2010]UJS03621.1 S41 family peptidase [Cylindrospermopsis raciborskii KLL07]
MNKWLLRWGFSLLLAFGVAFIWGFSYFVPSAIALTQQQKVVAEAWRIVNRSYIDASFNNQNWESVRQRAFKQPLGNDQAAYKVVRDMLKSLDDPFTRFLDPDQYRSLQVNTSGELTGIGLQIALNSETGILEVITPIQGSPAERAGLKPRDRILQIEGLSTENITLDEAAARMRGPIGTVVTLLIGREGQPNQEVVLVRDRIELNPVLADLRLSPEGMPIGYIRLSQFNANAALELANAINSMEEQGSTAYILDLRNNPGGLLKAGIEVARQWLDSGMVVYTVNRQGIQGSFEAFGPALTQDPLVILVNQGTASASEILAGALQDNGRAELVGETTFGKGLIQSLFQLTDGSGLAVTIAKYETPNHRDINKLGIKPDVEVKQSMIRREQVGSSDDKQYQAALEILNKKLLIAESLKKSN